MDKNDETPKPENQVNNRDKQGKFIKGVSGNPNGRPPLGGSWAELLREAGEEIDPGSGKPFKEAVSRRLWKECLSGNISAIKELMNRMEGMPAQSTDITSKGEKLPTPILGGISVSTDNSNKEDNGADKED